MGSIYNPTIHFIEPIDPNQANIFPLPFCTNVLVHYIVHENKKMKDKFARRWHLSFPLSFYFIFILCTYSHVIYVINNTNMLNYMYYFCIIVNSHMLCIHTSHVLLKIIFYHKYSHDMLYVNKYSLSLSHTHIYIGTPHRLSKGLYPILIEREPFVTNLFLVNILYSLSPRKKKKLKIDSDSLK